MKTPLLSVLTLFLFGCSHSLSLTKVHLTSPKGLTQTLTTKERLRPYENEEFILHQPHFKVVRIFSRSKENKTVLTTYYPSGQIYQLLECRNNQACGLYEEWSPKGTVKIKAQIIGGTPELDASGQASWIFDGKNEAYDDQGRLSASFNYETGLLENESLLFHMNGEIKERRNYLNGQLHGLTERFDSEGQTLEKKNYVYNLLDGTAVQYWNRGAISLKEQYHQGDLLSGLYFTPTGKLIAQVKNGAGNKIIWNEDFSFEKIQIENGKEIGKRSQYDSKGCLQHADHIKGGVKDGEEVFYFQDGKAPKLSVFWKNGQIHGTVRSWYANGNLESEREMSQNKKHGLLSARYENGDLMAIEEYDQDRLIKGQYFKRGSSLACSSVLNGEGSACIFDAKGILLQKVNYQGGFPVD